ncbi:helix-turn-helix domain-containing protein [Methylomonas sp. MED-D]|uniref:helix-turn-helix domain-containing protein n=1 Tax=unclassified Methylomonas TaxID=2608980 RepID=UPI0028A3D47C|nr:helix-turn-helix domain-containing protein [Methylomonas sp. MV1]MDT4330858.1 helix-turn-helix domain-containing protein [Methylomonas sp. MV1]
MAENTKKGGRPRGYRPQYVQLAHNYTLLGATEGQLAEFFNVSAATVKSWTKHRPEFADAIKRGKILADAEVANGLFRRGTGYPYTEVTTREIKNPAGEVTSVEVVTVTSEIPPDTEACIFWLTNRQPDKWRNRLEIEHADKRESSTPDQDTPATPQQEATP